MEWTIFSIGDSAFLESILNSVAMMVGNPADPADRNANNIQRVASIGMLLGVILMGFQSIIQGGTGIKFQTLLVSWIVFIFMFGQNTTAVIEDVYSGSVRPVANVPQGIVIAGSIMSTIGFKTTEIFEQGYGTAAMTSNGFASALEALSRSRKMTGSPADLGKANSPLAANTDNFWQSWTNYIQECTLTGVDLGLYTTDQIGRSLRFPGEGPMKQLFFQSGAYGTKLDLGGFTGSCGAGSANGFCTCTDAYATLEAYSTQHVVPGLFALFASQEGYRSPFSDDAEDNAAMVAAGMRLFGDAYNQVIARDILTTGQTMQDYMLASALYPVYNWAIQNNEMDFHRVAAATMLHSAIQARNTQWASEQALFNTVVRPMMTFFEGLIYAIAPIMAFLIGLGPMGIKLIGKYLLFVLWIQLWMPTMAIINLYLNMSISGKMDALASSNKRDIPLSSFYGINAIDQHLQTWISTAGMLAASVPGITLMLVYGSAVTATSLAGRLGSGSVNTGNMSPDVMNNDAAVLSQGMTTGNRMGTWTIGSEMTSSKLSIGSQRSSAISSMKEQAMTSQTQFSSELSSALQQNTAFTSSQGEAFGYSWAQSATGSQSFQRMSSIGESLVEGTSLQGQLNQQQLAALGMQASLSMDAGGKIKGGIGNNLAGSIGFKGSISENASYTTTDGQSRTFSEDDARRFEQNFAETKGRSSVLAEAVNESFAASDQNVWTQGISETQAASLKNSASRAYTDTEKLAQVDAQNSSLSRDLSMDHRTLGSVADNMGVTPAVQSYIQSASPAFRARMDENAGFLQSINPAYSANPEQLTTAAALMTMADGHHLHGMAPGDKLNALQSENAILGQLTGSSGASILNNNGVSGNDRVSQGAEGAVIAGNSAERTAGNVSGPQNDLPIDAGHALQDRVAMRTSNINPDNPPTLGDHYNDSNSNVSGYDSNLDQNDHYNSSIIAAGSAVGGNLFQNWGAAGSGSNMVATQWVQQGLNALSGQRDFSGDLGSSNRLYNFESDRNSASFTPQNIESAVKGVQGYFESKGMSPQDAAVATSQYGPAMIASSYASGVLGSAEHNRKAEEAITGWMQSSNYTEQANTGIREQHSHLNTEQLNGVKGVIAGAAAQIIGGEGREGTGRSDSQRMASDTLNRMNQSLKPDSM